MWFRRDVLRQMDLRYYLKKFWKYVNEGKVVIIGTYSTAPWWSEFFLHKWFAIHHKKLGFEKVVHDRTDEYLRLKEQVGFYGYPDFLALRNGKWLRVEIESFSSGYSHGHEPGYADVVLCYKITKPLENVEVISLRRFLGVEDIILGCNVLEWLHSNDEEFRDDYLQRLRETGFDWTEYLKPEVREKERTA